MSAAMTAALYVALTALETQMQMMSSVPTWLTVIAWTAIAVSLVSAAAIVFDVLARGNRQPTRTMEIVWPASALYLGPIALRELEQKLRSKYDVVIHEASEPGAPAKEAAPQ